MKHVTYGSDIKSEARLGVIVGDLIVDAQALGAQSGSEMPDTMLGLIDADRRPGVNALKVLIDAMGDLAPLNTSVPIANAGICAPIPHPCKNIWGVCLNYTEHVAESA